MRPKEELDAAIGARRGALETLLRSVPRTTVRIPTVSWNDFDNYGKNNDPETEWNNWVNWDQAPVPFDDSDSA